MQGSKLYVGNFGYSVTDDQLEELFSEHGDVKSAKVIGDKGFGFVEMSSNEEAEKADPAVCRRHSTDRQGWQCSHPS